MKPRCYDCLSEDVAVELIDEHGCKHWFCAKDWAANQEFGKRLAELLRGAVAL